MRTTISLKAMAVLGALAATGGALAANPPAGGDVPGVAAPTPPEETMMGPMAMGMPMAAMPSAYAGEADKPGAPVFQGLGAHHHPISTKNATTQGFFDQGVNLLFGFNHAEAIRSFREGARRDPDCAMCWWGVAFALGPNINLPMPDDAVTPARQALARARGLEAKASPEERDWIEALAARYGPDSTTGPQADRKALDEAYAVAMGRLWGAWPDDLDAGVFYAEAMMDTQPWDYWAPDGVTPKGHGAEIDATLERILARAPDHPGALHLYIHAVEASTTPQRAEAAADRLSVLMPGAGHIVHMPSHIYYRVGRYADAVRVNEAAARVDEAYIAACKAQGFYPAGYYGHNIHFLWTSSEMEGRSAAALSAARRLVKAVNAVALAKALPLGELYVFTPTVTLLRFGRWRDILSEPAPPAELPLDMAVWLYARGFAHANLGQPAEARADRARLAGLIGTDFRRYAPFNLPAAKMIDLSLALLDGEIERTTGHLDAAVTRFQAASAIEATLPYTEPPYWHQPVSHLLGAALIEDRRPAEAEAVYRRGLQTYRADGWTLFGLAQALNAEGRQAEAARTRRAFAKAWSLADVTLTSSRF